MNLSLLVLWALVGWCGTVPRRWPPPGPDPGPDPWWLIARIMGAVFGLVGGWTYIHVFEPDPQPWISVLPAAASALGAFVAARFATDIFARLSGGTRQ